MWTLVLAFIIFPQTNPQWALMGLGIYETRGECIAAYARAAPTLLPDMALVCVQTKNI